MWVQFHVTKYRVTHEPPEGNAIPGELACSISWTNESGHLMQGRFGATVVDEDEYIIH